MQGCRPGLIRVRVLTGRLNVTPAQAAGSGEGAERSGGVQEALCLAGVSQPESSRSRHGQTPGVCLEGVTLPALGTGHQLVPAIS